MSRLLSTRSCGLLHTGSIHGAFKTGEQRTDWKFKKFLRALHQILHASPARWNDYADVTGSSRFPVPFWDTRWIEDGQVAVWAIEIWDDICHLCTFWQSLSTSKRPSSQSYLTLLSSTKDPLILAKLHFFSCIACTRKPFLTEYQYAKPMIPFMHDDLHQLLRDVVSKYIKPETLEKCKNASILFDVNFNDAKNRLKNKEVDIGFGPNKILTDKMKTDETAKRETAMFTADLLKFFESFTRKFVEKSPL